MTQFLEREKKPKQQQQESRNHTLITAHTLTSRVSGLTWPQPKPNRTYCECERPIMNSMIMIRGSLEINFSFSIYRWVIKNFKISTLLLYDLIKLFHLLCVSVCRRP